jgi:hypothetical protein
MAKNKAADSRSLTPSKPAAKGAHPIAPFDMAAGSKALTSPNTMYDPTELPSVGSAAHALVQFYGAESRIAGDIQKRIGVFNPRLIGTDTRLLMRQDPVIAFGLAILEAPIVNLGWSIESKDPVIKAFCQWAVGRVYRNMAMAGSNAVSLGRQICDKIFDSLPLKLQVSDDVSGEETEQAFTNVWTISRFKAIDPRTYHFLIDPAIDDWVGVEQLFMRPQSQSLAPVPKEKLLLWSFRREKNFGRLEGMSALDQSYEPWWFSAATEWIANHYFERKADPPMKIRSGNKINVGGKEVDGFAYMAGQAMGLRSGGIINLPSLKEKDGKNYLFDIEFLQDDKRGDQLQHRIDALQISKLRGLWVTDRAGTSGGGQSNGGSRGGRAESQSHAELMAQSQEAIIAEWIEDVVQPCVIDPLVRYNFGEDAWRESQTRIVSGGVSQSLQEVYKDVLLALFQAEAAVQNGSKIRAWEYLQVPAILKTLGMPLRDPQELEELVDEREQQAADMQAQMQQAGNPQTQDVNLGDPELEKAVRDKVQKTGAKTKQPKAVPVGAGAK